MAKSPAPKKGGKPPAKKPAKKPAEKNEENQGWFWYLWIVVVIMLWAGFISGILMIVSGGIMLPPSEGEKGRPPDQEDPTEPIPVLVKEIPGAANLQKARRWNANVRYQKLMRKDFEYPSMLEDHKKLRNELGAREDLGHFRKDARGEFGPNRNLAKLAAREEQWLELKNKPLSFDPRPVAAKAKRFADLLDLEERDPNGLRPEEAIELEGLIEDSKRSIGELCPGSAWDQYDQFRAIYFDVVGSVWPVPQFGPKTR